MSDGTARSTTLLVWAVPVFVVGALAVLLFSFSAWLEGGSEAWGEGLLFWLRLDAQSAVDTVSNAAEVVAGVLAIAITVVAIVVELAATRYTHRITQLFVRSPVNSGVLGFFVLTAIQCLWISSTTHGTAAEAGGALPFAGVAMAMSMVTICLLVLLPYFVYVLAFVDPLAVVNRIRSHTFESIRRASVRHRGGSRAATISGIGQLEDVAINAIEHKDRGIAIASVEALAELVTDYGPLRRSMPDSWFRIDGSLTHDPDFVSMAPLAREDIERDHTWFEVKVLRQYHSLFTDSLNKVRDVSNLIALNTRRLATAALPDHPRRFELCVRFFNSYLRAAINAEDQRTAYYVLHQYRLLAEEVIRLGEDGRVVPIMEHFRYYGLLADAHGLPFLLEAVAYDVALVAELVVEQESPVADAVLEVFLQVDKESESPDQESSLRGVRRAQVQLAAYLLLRGDERRARLVYQDMAHERPERLASIRDELLGEERSVYWEFTDRAVNFAYLPPDRRKMVVDFFRWFGDRLPQREESP